MVVRNLPCIIDSSSLSSVERFLYEVHQVFKDKEQHEPPTIRFFTTVRNYFGDGCTIVSVSKWQPPQVGDSFMEWLLDAINWVTLSRSPQDTFVGYDEQNSISYLASPLILEDDRYGVYLVVWRKNMLFFSSDVLAIRLAISLYVSLHNRTENSQMGELRPDVLSGEVTGFLETYKKIKCAVDTIEDIVIIFDISGTLVWMNKRAQECLTINFGKISCEEMHLDKKMWLANLIHPDDIPLVMNKVEGAIRDRRKTEFLARIPVGVSQYRPYNCSIFCCTEFKATDDEFIFQAKPKPPGMEGYSNAFEDALEMSIRTVDESLHNCPGDSKAKQDILNLRQVWAQFRIIIHQERHETEHLDVVISKTYLEEVLNSEIFNHGKDLVPRNIVVMSTVDPRIPRAFRTDQTLLHKILSVIIAKGIERIPEQDSWGAISINFGKLMRPNGMSLSIECCLPLESQPIIPDAISVQNLHFVLLNKYAELLRGEAERIITDSGESLKIYLPFLQDPNPYDGNFQTRDMALHSLHEFIRSYRSSTDIVLGLVSITNTALEEHLTALFQRVPGLKVVRAGLTEKMLKADVINICVVESLDANTAAWACMHDADIVRKARFVVLFDTNVDPFFDGVTTAFMARPLIETNIINTVHESIIRYVLGLARAFDPKFSPSSTANHAMLPKPTIRNLAESYPLGILVAEDSELNLKVLVKTLQKCGYTDIATAENGQEAVEQVKRRHREKNSIELIFMDMKMPVMDGCEASLLIREFINGQAPVDTIRPHIIALTANTFFEDRRACLRSGMCSFTSKPLQLELLEKVLIEGYAAIHGEMTCRCQSENSFSW